MDACSAVQYVDFDERYLDGMLKIAIDRFGENYIDKNKILSLADKDEAMCSLAVSADTKDVLGYCLFFEENMEKASKDFKIPKDEMIAVTGSDSSLCHAKSMALKRGSEKRGLGYNLFNRTLDKAQKIGYKVAWCPAWKRGDFIPVEKVLLRLGFNYFKTVHRIWEDDKDYKCIECHGPCKCDAAVYYKILN